MEKRVAFVAWIVLTLGCAAAPPQGPRPAVPSPDSLPPSVSSGPPEPRSAPPILSPPTGEPLPEHAAPKAWVIEAESVGEGDVIAYRPLTRADFRGTEPPQWFAAVRAQVGAATCGQILTTPDTELSIEQKSQTEFEARVSRLRFIARMDRGCSWWNPENPGYPDAYILQHEQIHFALFELEARKLDALADELGAGVRGRGATADAAHAEAQRQLQALLTDYIDVVLERSRAFDQDTSLGYDPEAQERWWRQVNQELAP